MKSRYLISFVVLALIAVLGLFTPQQFTIGDQVGLDKADIAWMLTASGLVLLMTPGLSFFYGGMVSKKNIISTMLQSFIALGVITLLFVIVGFSLCFGDSYHGLIGNPFQYAFFQNVGFAIEPKFATTIPLILFAIFQLKFAIITPALITGSFAERVKFNAYLIFICLFSLFIYCPLAHWTWHPDGFLRQWGVLDFAGGTVVHMSAGYAALAGAMFLGPRTSFGDSKHTEPANIPFVILGTGMLWFGWFGFNAGSSLGANLLAIQAFATTIVASATAMMGWIFFDAARGKKISAMGACIGAVVGLGSYHTGCRFRYHSTKYFYWFYLSSNIKLSRSRKKQIQLRRYPRCFSLSWFGWNFGNVTHRHLCERSGFVLRTNTYISLSFTCACHHIGLYLCWFLYFVLYHRQDCVVKSIGGRRKLRTRLITTWRKL